MKKSAKRMIAASLSTVIAAGVIVPAVYVLTADGKNAEHPASSVSTQEVSEFAVSKDETVYVIAGADGSVQKIIVSDWLRNTLGSSTIIENSELTDVKNVKGDETYTLNGGNARVWDAQGNDIYYQGNIEKELPVTLSVTYQLDGRTISSEELVGKSGRVTIRFDYANQQYEYVEINGKKEKLYVPFAMLTGMLLDNAVFTNVEVSNGKLINDGDRTAVVGVAFPGLQENLAISADTFEIPDYVEITADVTDFQLGMTMTMATNTLFSDMDVDSTDKIDELSSSLEEMSEAMEQLIDGSSQLCDGLSELLHKSGDLAKGVDSLASGAEALKKGTNDLSEGVSQLHTGAGQLSEGLHTLTENNGSLNGGAEQVFESLLSAADTQIASAGLDVPQLTIENYADVLNSVIASLDESNVYEQALSKVTEAVAVQQGYIEEQVTAAVSNEVTAQVTAAVEAQVREQVMAAVRENVKEQVIYAAVQMDRATYESAVAAGLIEESVQTAVENAVSQQMQSDTVMQMIEARTAEQMASGDIQALISGNVSEQMNSDAVRSTIASNTELQMQKAVADNMASEEVQAQISAASEGAKALISLKTSLDSYHSFYIGLQSYTAGVSQAASGAADLKNGVDSLKKGTDSMDAGTEELYKGILKLKESMPSLTDGVSQLNQGALQLSDGLKEFNEQGIQKLVDAVDGDIAGLSERLRATIDVSKRYCSFSDNSGAIDGNVKFIYRTDAIE